MSVLFGVSTRGIAISGPYCTTSQILVWSNLNLKGIAGTAATMVTNVATATSLVHAFFIGDAPGATVTIQQDLVLPLHKLPNQSSYHLRLFVNYPVRAIRHALDRQNGHKLLQPLQIARQEIFILLAPDHQRWHPHHIH